MKRHLLLRSCKCGILLAKITSFTFKKIILERLRRGVITISVDQNYEEVIAGLDSDFSNREGKLNVKLQQLGTSSYVSSRDLD